MCLKSQEMLERMNQEITEAKEVRVNKTKRWSLSLLNKRIADTKKETKRIADIIKPTERIADTMKPTEMTGDII